MAAANQSAPGLPKVDVNVLSIDKFPRMVDYVVPTGVRIGDATACVWVPTFPKAPPSCMPAS